MTVKVPIVSSLDDKGFRDADRAIERLSKAGGATGAWAAATQRADAAAQPLNRALIGVAAAGALAVRAASDQEQAFGALTAVYGQSAGQMRSWAAEQSAVGLSAAEAAQQAAYLGSMLTGAGVSAQDAAAQSQRLVGLGADLAATFGGSTADAVSALGAAMRGEFDPLERFGVSIKQADINARLAAEGNSELTGEALRSAQAAALQALIFEKTAAAQGQAGREAGSAAGSTARATAELRNAGAAITSGLLPAVAGAATALGTLAGWFGQHPPLLYALVAARVAIMLNNAAMAVYLNRVVLLAAAQKAATAARALLTGAEVAARVGYAALQVLVFDNIKQMALWAAGQVRAAATTAAATAATIGQRAAMIAGAAAAKAAAAAQWLLNAAMTANPIGLLIALIVALVAGIVLLWQRNEAFRNAMTAAWNAIRNAVGSAVDGIRGFIDGLIDRFQRLWDKVRAIKDKIAGALRGVVDLLPFGGGEYTVTGPARTFFPAAPSVARPASSTGAGTAAPVAVAAPQVRVYVDDHRLRDLIRVEIDGVVTPSPRVLSGVRA